MAGAAMEVAVRVAAMVAARVVEVGVAVRAVVAMEAVRAAVMVAARAVGATAVVPVARAAMAADSIDIHSLGSWCNPSAQKPHTTW